MTRYLVKKCSKCGEVITVRMNGGSIEEVEGGKRPYIHGRYFMKLSNKTIQCVGNKQLPGKNATGKCGTRYFLSDFEEIKCG